MLQLGDVNTPTWSVQNRIHNKIVLNYLMGCQWEVLA